MSCSSLDQTQCRISDISVNILLYHIYFQLSLNMRAHTMIGLERTVESPKLDGVLKISQKIPIHRETSKILS